jgi:hypothetical protein
MRRGAAALLVLVALWLTACETPQPKVAATGPPHASAEALGNGLHGPLADLMTADETEAVARAGFVPPADAPGDNAPSDETGEPTKEEQREAMVTSILQVALTLGAIAAPFFLF